MGNRNRRIEPGKPGDGMLVLRQHPLYSGAVMRDVAAVDVGGTRFVRQDVDEEWELEDGRIVAVVLGGTRYEKVRECELEKSFDGTFNYDYTCSSCGKVHNAPRANERCPRCGAHVKGVR